MHETSPTTATHNLHNELTVSTETTAKSNNNNTSTTLTGIETSMTSSNADMDQSTNDKTELGDTQQDSLGQEKEKSSNEAASSSSKAATKTGSITPTAGTNGGSKTAATSGATNSENKSSSKKSDSTTTPPIMKGTFSYDLETRRHLIRGMWNYENSTQFTSQRFELQRRLDDNEDIKTLPLSGEFSGSFSLVYVHVTSKGKQKQKTRVVSESNVQVNFIKKDDKDEYVVEGRGLNQFGVFNLNGSAKPSPGEDDPTWNIIFRKTYDDSLPPDDAAAALALKTSSKKSSKAIAEVAGDATDAVLPPPSTTYKTGVICLRGKISKKESEALGVTEVVHKITGMWGSGLDLIQNDPENKSGMLGKFEYDHKSSAPAGFPVSGRYSGWFELNEKASKSQINERDIMLKFRKNNAGYYNIDGKGSNVFGKYTITGTLTEDKTITIFRHFAPRKVKSVKTVTSAPPPINAPQASRPAATTTSIDTKFKLTDVEITDVTEPGQTPQAYTPPPAGVYSAVSRGVLRVNDDGSHSCQGKWAVTSEHFTNGQTSNFNFRLEAHHAAEAVSASSDGQAFPLDSNMYKGSFQLKKTGYKSATIVDQQIVMKFLMNTQGSYNVYGKGYNSIGEFNLFGTLVKSGKTGGQVELFRLYPPEKMAAAAVAPVADPVGSSKPVATAALSSTLPVMPPPLNGLQRRESTRIVKLPSKLEDDDPTAQLARIMEKCGQILRIIRAKDDELGGYFREPVDPVALGIPTYHQIIKEPMDLRTIHRKMESNKIDNADEFARLVRLVFQNAILFNVDPSNAVHQSARALLALFNQKYREVERMLETYNRVTGTDGKGQKKGDKKRKRGEEPPKSLKKQRLEEAQAMIADNARAASAVLAAAPSTSSGAVTRGEFTALFDMIQQLQSQVVQTYQAIVDMSPDDENDDMNASFSSLPGLSTHAAAASSGSRSNDATTSSVVSEKKKSKKRKVEEIVEEVKPPVVDDFSPLTLDEQELLTNTINELPQDKLMGVIQIIRESSSIGADEDEIDLEIDQLDQKTQRKLLKHVMQFVKKPNKQKARKKVKTAAAAAASTTTTNSKRGKKSDSAKQVTASTPTAAAASAITPTKKQSKSSKPKSSAGSFFAFGSKGDSDSDSDDDDNNNDAKSAANNKETSNATSGAAAEFSLASGLGELNDDLEDDDMENLAATNWNISANLAQTNSKSADGVEDDAWDAAKEEAAAAKVRETERKAREKKLQEEAEALNKQRMQEAAARTAELKAKREQEEAAEAALKEQQEKEAEEARRKERERQREKIKAVERTVDMDATRDIMKQYEQSIMDDDIGNASPSSDYGF